MIEPEIFFPDSVEKQIFYLFDKTFDKAQNNIS